VSEPVDVVVRAGDCPCPGTPHTEEHVYLEPEASLLLATTAFKAVQLARETVQDQIGALTSSYIPAAIRSWTFLEESEGIVPVPITRENAERLIPWDRGGFEVADKADDLYSERVMAPLVKRLQQLSVPGQTASGTPPSPLNGSEHPVPSKRSSRESSGAGKPFVAPAR
jgi:hypothetical protein